MAELDFIPQQLAGWRRAGPGKSYNRETIFDYIDGAGEVYRLFDFREVVVYQFTHEKVAPVDLEVFDMGSAGDAYGIFTFYHEGEEVAVGRGAYRRPGLLNFWQGRYFVCLTSPLPPSPEQEDTAVVQLAKEIASRMPTAGDPPDWLEHFPASERRAQSLRYFHDHRSLNYHLYLNDENVLQLTAATQCALARYRRGEESFYQLWARYPDSAAADTAMASFSTAMLSPDATDGIARQKNKRWTAVTRDGQFIAIAYDVPTRAIADSVRNAALNILQKEIK